MTLLQIILLYSSYVSLSCCESVGVASDVPEYCAQGQVAWCQNFTTSIECRSTKHCQSVWLIAKSTSHGSCGSCETQIQKVRHALDSGLWDLDINELTEGICRSTCNSQFCRLECQNLLNQYARHHTPEWLKFLQSEVHPATVCQVIGVCSEFKSYSVPGNSVALQGCTSNLCYNLTSSRKCKTTSLCIRRVWSNQLYAQDDDSVCLVCEDMVHRARNQLQKNETLGELRRVLQASCKLITIKEVLRECLRLADNFLLELAEILVSRMSSTGICTVTNLCNNVQIDNLLNAVAEPVSIRMLTNLNNSSGPEHNRADSLCFFCQYLLHFIQEELEKPEKQQKIEEAMNRTCELAPRSMQTECQSFVFEYGALMISLFSQKIDPSLVCPALKICPHNASLEDRCHQCLTLVENMTATLGKNHSETQILQALSSSMTVSNLTMVAIEMRYNHQQRLVHLMGSQSNSSATCTRLHFCDPQMLSLS